MRILALLLMTASVAHATIYGDDDLAPLSRTRPGLQTAAGAVALMAPNTSLIVRADGRYDLDSVPLSDSWNLCADEPAAATPSLFTGCTGFLVAEDLLLTAGHCAVNSGTIEHESNAFCANFTWIFGVNDRDSKTPMKNIDAANVFECAEIVRAKHLYSPVRKVGEEVELKFDRDWALIRLKRKTGRVPLELAKQAPAVGETVEMLGHPMAMALMSSKGRVLRDEPQAFATTLDSFGGNSGSPILNAAGEVVGILVRGFPDDTFTDEKNQCSRLNRCDESGRSCLRNDPIYAHGDQGQKLIDEIRTAIDEARTRPR